MKQFVRFLVNPEGLQKLKTTDFSQLLIFCYVYCQFKILQLL